MYGTMTVLCIAASLAYNKLVSSYVCSGVCHIQFSRQWAQRSIARQIRSLKQKSVCSQVMQCSSCSCWLHHQLARRTQSVHSSSTLVWRRHYSGQYRSVCRNLSQPLAGKPRVSLPVTVSDWQQYLAVPVHQFNTKR